MRFKIILCLCVMLLQSCTAPTPEGPARADHAERVPLGEIPGFDDDLSRESLKTAVEQSLSFYDRIPGDRTFSLGDMQIRAEVLKTSLLHFLKLMEANRLDRESVTRAFHVYRVGSSNDTLEPALVTGYYEPILDGRLVQDEEFCYPLYGVPSDLLTINPADFDAGRSSEERLVGRLEGSRVVPYFTRAEIDGEGKLNKSAQCMVWLKDPIEAFFLHIQGSGIVRLSDGRLVRVGYAGSNGRPYRSIGKYLLEKGVISREEMSLQAIRDYLRTHSYVQNEIMWYNKSYVFFRWVDQGPVGSLNVVLTAGRSVATDVRYYPRGALGFLRTEKPRLDTNGQVTGWEPLNRWVLNQDTGGAIKGSSRVDLFCGSGETAEWMAGRLKQPGKLYFLVKKEENGD
jgi:membrane-bound lytic murein transglycosylase A